MEQNLYRESLSFMSYVPDLMPAMLRTIPSHGLLCVPALVANTHNNTHGAVSQDQLSLKPNWFFKIISISPLQKH